MTRPLKEPDSTVCSIGGGKPHPLTRELRRQKLDHLSKLSTTSLMTGEA